MKSKSMMKRIRVQRRAKEEEKNKLKKNIETFHYEVKDENLIKVKGGI
jgi:hypothetical protein